MYCRINGWGYFGEKKALFVPTSFKKKGGGRIFEGGLIFGRLWYYVAYVIAKSSIAEPSLMGEFSIPHP